MATGQQLQHVYELIKGGHKEHAAALLAVWLVSDPCNADAWWLLALAAPSVDIMERALTRLLELRPDDLRARQLRDSMSVRQLRADARIASAEMQQAVLPAYPPAGMEPRLPRLRRRSNKRGGGNPSSRPKLFFVALAFSTLFAVFGCALLALAVISGFRWLGRTFEGPQPSLAAGYNGEMTANPLDLGDINALGNTGYAQFRAGTLTASNDRHPFVFVARSGDWITIEVTTPDSALDPAIALYSEDGTLIGGNTDRAPDNSDAALALALPRTGTYTAVVIPQAGTGSYQLALRH